MGILGLEESVGRMGRGGFVKRQKINAYTAITESEVLALEEDPFRHVHIDKDQVNTWTEFFQDPQFKYYDKIQEIANLYPEERSLEVEYWDIHKALPAPRVKTADDMRRFLMEAGVVQDYSDTPAAQEIRRQAQKYADKEIKGIQYYQERMKRFRRESKP